MDTKEILKKCSQAHRHLGVLKESVNRIPNPDIIIRTLALREAQQSSEIENIFTTQEKIFQKQVNEEITDIESREVTNYYNALRYGYKQVKNSVLGLNCIIQVQGRVRGFDEGFRTGENRIANREEIIYLPPADIDYMHRLLDELELYINDENQHDIDPLIKMIIIHYQFESIHPFSDGNGRTGRILNILYLVNKELLSLPTLYLSSYINKHKSLYYSGLQNIRDSYNTTQEADKWREFIHYMLDGLIEVSQKEFRLITEISALMQEYKIKIRDELKLRFYSQDLINHLFKYPYTRNSHLQNDLKISPPTAIEYFKTLSEHKLLERVQIGKDVYYINKGFWNILSNKNHD